MATSNSEWVPESQTLCPSSSSFGFTAVDFGLSFNFVEGSLSTSTFFHSFLWTEAEGVFDAEGVFNAKTADIFETEATIPLEELQ